MIRSRRHRLRVDVSRRIPGLWGRFACPFAFTAVLFSAVLVPRGEAAETLSGPVPARVIRVVDGDTIQVRARIWLSQEVETRVRLAGVDAPELRSSCDRERDLAVRARLFLAARLPSPGARVVLSDIRFGKYAGRVLARVRDGNGVDLAEALLEAGLARPYAGQARTSWCAAPLEEAATPK